jgi:16S rRNA (cytosine967-C5)-methyltransferase
LDLCAAPGGKTAQLAAAGANVVALDRSAQRLKRLRQNLARLRLEQNVEVIVADASVWQPRTPAPLILCDAPCTATGTIRRHPDIFHLKTQTDLQRLVTVQAEILDNAFRMLAPGGVLIYCVCSLQKEEGEHQIANLIARYPTAHKLPITAQEVGGLSEILTEDGDVRSLPYHLPTLGGLDGFYISRITKAE